MRVPDLYGTLRRLIAQIPEGRVTTYGHLATALGTVRAARWVGEFLLQHDHDEGCPCHRVVRQDGEIGLYVTGDPSEKLARLASEGIRAVESRVDLEESGFATFRCRAPLRRLAAEQDVMRDAVDLSTFRRSPRLVAGVDVSYDGFSQGAPGWACATCALVDTRTLELADSTTVRRRVRFPYITGFLSYREVPLLLAVLDELTRRVSPPDVVLVDGNGILHPRRVGVATFLGIRSGLRTIGVGKSFLCGSLDEGGEGPRAIRLEGDVVGYEVASGAGFRPVYVSPGHRINATNALRIVRGLFGEHRVPEPVYYADRISRAAVKSESC